MMNDKQIIRGMKREHDRLIHFGRDLERQLAKSQGKLQEMRGRTYDLHRQSGHPDAACLRCQLHDIIIDESS